MKKQKSVVLDTTNLEYVNTVISRNISNTIDMLVSKFRENNIQVNFLKQFDTPSKNTGAVLSTENIDFLETIKTHSFAFTLNCLLATAKDLALSPM